MTESMTDSDQRTAHHRQACARRYLKKKTLEMGAVDNALRDVAAYCRSAAWLEKEPARSDELAAVANAFEDEIERISALSGRAWAATRRDWEPRSDEDGV